MTGKKLQRLLACLLAVLLLSQVGAFSPAVFAADYPGRNVERGCGPHSGGGAGRWL